MKKKYIVPVIVATVAIDDSIYMFISFSSE